MTPERYQRLSQLYHEALEVAPEARPGFLDGACGPDEKLRREVESLLAAHNKAGNYFATPALEVAAGLVANEEKPSLAGKSFSHYRVISLIGAGGMGDVYLAEDTRLGRKVALKMLPKEFTQDQGRVLRFEQEARVASSLSHPNIVTIYEVGQIDGRHFIATEYIDGQTLRGRLIDGQITVQAAVEVGVQMASALTAAHEAGIVHRDIKPENVMVRRDGLVKVLDFGLAKLADRRSQSGVVEATIEDGVISTPGLVLGTAAYMSPEQARGLEVDHRTDIFSLGVVLYEMIAGVNPIAGATDSDVINILVKTEPQPISYYAPDCPLNLQEIILNAMKKNAGQRFQTAEEFLNAMKAVSLEAVLKDPANLKTSLILSNKQIGLGTIPQLLVKPPTTLASNSVDVSERKSSNQQAKTAIKPGKKSITTIFLSLVFLIVGITLFFYELLSNDSPSTEATVLEPVSMRKVTVTGKAIEAVISSDGKYLAYVIGEKTKGQSLWIRHLLTSRTIQLDSSPACFSDYFGRSRCYGNLTFSPDGNYVYYVRAGVHSGPNGTLTKSVHGNELYMISFQGGSKKLVVDNLSAESFGLSPDGRQIAFPRWTQDRREIHLIVSNIDATNERKVATKTEDLIGKPAWSPDGRSIAFSASNERGAGIVEIQLEDGTERVITSQIFRDILDLEWLPDNSGLVAIAINKSEATSQIWFISYPAGEARRVTNDANHYMSLNSTADSSTLCAIQRSTHSTISVIPKEKNGLAKQINAGAASDGSAGIAWMPDGNIVYTSNSGDNTDIWLMEADGTNQTQLTSNAGQNIHPSVSSDGQFIFFASNRTGTFHIWRMNRDGNNQEQLTKGNGESYPQYSSYGKCLIYESETPNSMGSKRVLRMPIDGGEPIPIIDKQSYHPIISPDGKMVAFRIFSFGYDNNGIVVAPIEGGSVTGILKGTFESTPFCWSRDSGALMYLGDQSGQPVNRKPGEKLLWTRRLNGSTSQQIMSIDKDVAFFEQSKEGKWFLYAKPFQTDDVILIKRFR